MRSTIFNHIDAEAKYLGFTAFEIGTLIAIVLFGFIFNSMIIATFGCFGSVVAIRQLKRLLKASQLKRRVFFWASDLIAVKNQRTNFYAKYFI
jgi:hypothetical protein